MTDCSPVDEGVTKLPSTDSAVGSVEGGGYRCGCKAVAVPAEDISPVPPTGGLFV